MTTDNIIRTAEISLCTLFRYELTRRWSAGARLLPVIMLNPSTADHEIDDRTIGRCMEFARREMLDGIRVMNLFGFRATKPAEMRAAVDPIGPLTNDYLGALLRCAVDEDLPVLAAWGTHGGYGDRDRAIVARAKDYGARLVCLGETRDGFPKHPLYIKGSTKLAPYKGRP